MKTSLLEKRKGIKTKTKARMICLYRVRSRFLCLSSSSWSATPPKLLLMAILAVFLLSFLLASIFLLALLKNFSHEYGRKPNLPPSPLKLPIIGNLHQLGELPHLSFQRLTQKLGPIIYLKLGEIPTIVVSSAKLAKEVMRTHDPALCSRPQIYSAQHLFYNCTDIAFSPYGSYWKQLRRICILELLSAKRVQSFGFIREEEVATMVASILHSSRLGPVNLTRQLAPYANNIVCRVALGKNYSQGGEYDRHGFQKMLEEYQVLLGGFSFGDFFPSMEWTNVLTGMKSRLRNTFHRFDRFFDEVIAEHLDPNRTQVEHKDLVDVLLDIQKNSSLEMPLTLDNIKAVILDMFAAGTDTTFITLDWGMTELIMNPKAMKKAQTEVRSVLGERSKVEESDIHQLPYLTAVIKEIFRLHPPAPVLVPRESIEDVRIDGYDIPAKTRIFVNAWAIGRDPESWKNPLEFEPERFIGSPIDFKGRDFELIPFGAGRRGCPAISFGSTAVELALAQLLYSFDWELPTGKKAKDLDLTEVFGITMHRIEELIVVAKPYFP